MKVLPYIAGFAVVATSVVAINTASASAATTSAACDVTGVKLGEKPGEKMVVSGNKITATFEVVGKNCTTPVTLAVWKSPTPDTQRINEQVLFGSKTLPAVAPGKHTITMTLPDDCYFQADLLVGDKDKAPDGTPNYAYQNGQILTQHPLRDWKFGGKRNCLVTPQPPKKPEQPKFPEGGPKPQVQAVQTTPVAATTPTTLPETGAGAVAATFAGVSTVGGAVHALIRRLKRQ